MKLFPMLYLAGMVLAEVIRFPHRMRNKLQRRRHELAESHISAVEIGADLLCWTAMEVLPLVYIFGHWPRAGEYELPPAAGWLGALLFAGGLWVIWRAHQDLGRNWSPTLDLQQEHQLVTNGIYARMRHPIYAGMWLWACAQPLLLQNWFVGMAGLLTFALVYATRVPKEEKMMLDRFGAQYRAYMDKTGAILPRLQGKTVDARDIE